MRKQSAGHSRLFFIEFLIVLFFFLIISTVCLKLFVHAHQVTEHADDLSRAQTAAASVAELMLSGYGGEDALKMYAGEGSVQDSQGENTIDMQSVPDSDSFSLCLDDCFITVTEHAASAAAKTAHISVGNEKNEVIYELSVTLHEPLTRGEVLP